MLFCSFNNYIFIIHLVFKYCYCDLIIKISFIFLKSSLCSIAFSKSRSSANLFICCSIFFESSIKSLFVIVFKSISNFDTFEIFSGTCLIIVLGMILLISLYSICFFRLLLVSTIASFMDFVTMLEYKITFPSILRAALTKSLNKTCVTSQKTFFICIHNSDKGYFRQIQSFP